MSRRSNRDLSSHRRPRGSFDYTAEPLEPRLFLHDGHDHSNRASAPAPTGGEAAPPPLIVNPFTESGGRAVGDPMLPDLFALASQPKGYVYGWYLDTTEIPGRLLLRLSTAVANQGRGAMELRGSTLNADGTQNVLQRVYHEGGGFHDQLAGTFTYHEAHSHIHFDNFAAYRLRAVTAGNGVGDVTAAGDKVSFCLLDIDRFNPNIPGSPASRVYNSCGQVQGISAGWADVYDDSLPDQWIDVTDVAPGQYWLEVIADPDNRLQETDETNNVTRILIDFTRPELRASSHTPTGTQLAYEPVSSLDVRFNGPVHAPSVGLDDVVSFTGPGGRDLRESITSMTLVEPSVLRIAFAPVAAGGAYSLVLGPNVLAAGTLRGMDQDNDGTPGEATADRYTAGFALNTHLGADGFGYTARPAAAEPIDLSAADPRVRLLLDGQDDANAAIDLGGRSFRFYGVNYTGTAKLFVSTNGLVTFDGGSNSVENGGLTSAPGTRAIAVLWDDWVTDNTSTDQVLYRFDDTNGDGTDDRLVIEWSGVLHYDDTLGLANPVTFQALLRLNTGATNGDIVLNYVDTDTGDSHAHGGTASVGIKDAGTQGANRLLIVQNVPGNVASGRAIRISTGAAVIGRHLFYNNSAFDGADPAANAADDGAIAGDKQALLPYRAASFANYSSYSKGINGVMVDVLGLPGNVQLAPGDFVFRAGNTATPANWALAPEPTVTTRATPGAPGSSRVSLVWPDGAIAKRWLQVTVKSDMRTGLTAPDTFYFGNAVGESGNGTGDTFVNGTDFAGARDNQRGSQNPAPITWRWDYNRDGLVNGTDLAIARDNAAGSSTSLLLLVAPDDSSWGVSPAGAVATGAAPAGARSVSATTPAKPAARANGSTLLSHLPRLTRR